MRSVLRFALTAGSLTLIVTGAAVLASAVRLAQLADELGRRSR